MKQTIFIIFILIILLSTVLLPVYVEASEGLPGSAKFGYGARVDLNGEHLDKAIDTATAIGLDWVAVEFNWEEMWPDPSAPPMITPITEVILRANQNGISVLLTISNPAQWAMTDTGPDPQTTANLILSLVDFYSGKILAVELFPGVNTKAAWKEDPNPAAYLETIKRTHETLLKAGQQVAIVTTLTPEAADPSPKDIKDLLFVSDLYALGGKPYLTIIGVRYNKLTGEPISNPGPYVLRHYEEVRSIMLNNEHNYGTVWITGFQIPTNVNFNAAHAYQTPDTVEEQSDWVEEAYKLMRAQLYIGVAIFDQINPSSSFSDQPHVTIITKNSSSHPIADRIMHLIQGLNSDNEYISGSNQENNTYLSILIKKFVRQVDFKLR